MATSQKTDTAVNRSESLVTSLLRIIDTLPESSFKDKAQESLNHIRSAIQGLRPPRIMVIGRCRSGKSSLINAICGLKVADVSDTRPETGKSEWKEYYHNGTDLLHILDTRGLQEARPPRQDDAAATPYDSIMRAVKTECPDIILFLCKATEVHSASQEDLKICEEILTEISKKHHRDLPVVGVLTKCDELAPPMIPLPTKNERKNRNIKDQVDEFLIYLNAKDNLKPHVKAVVPTAAYAEYEEGKNGLICSDPDYRWQITELVEIIIKNTPRETHNTIARMARYKKFQMTVARTIVSACVFLCGAISLNPIPGTSVPPVAIVQTFMVMYIGWLSGREFSEQTLKDFVLPTGVGIGANIGMIGIADIALKFIPGLGSILSASASVVATQGLGDSAIIHFFEKTA